MSNNIHTKLPNYYKLLLHFNDKGENMLNVRSMVKAMFVGVLALFMMVSQADAGDKPLKGKNLVVMVSAADVHKAGMGITIGMAASSDAGANVTIVLGAGAVQYVLKDTKNSYFKPVDNSLQEVVKTAISSGADVCICGMCAKSLGLKQADLVAGVKIVDGAAIFGKVFAPDARVISF